MTLYSLGVAGTMKSAQWCFWNYAVALRWRLFITSDVGLRVGQDRHWVAGPSAFLTDRPFPLDVCNCGMMASFR